ncbi:DUF938 domain-containing protein [Pleurocapsa sp. PCC 7319]|uniref:DUF938 domain-containing protein n=1 Tax=Pleurocapsa sp. PCC 7319 TaxID=118161 RepID=UPI0003456AFF|nr:DUF938 domain-containing protein [Pleurocapsa sp. PCC 7319]
MRDARQYAPATQRNREPILEILTKILPAKSNVLEIASGTGEHAVFFASQLQSCHWIPSDNNPLACESIIAWKNFVGVDNLDTPLKIDVTKDDWIDQLATYKIDAIVNINMIHIAPWQACLSLMNGAGQILPPGGILYLYGPYKRDGEHTAPSNANFDRSLRDRNDQWGVRDLEAVIEVAATAKLRLQQVIEMPANNLSVIFSR